MQIHVDEEAIDVLERYCKIRPSTPEIIVGRVLREWYSLAAKHWDKNPRLMPILPKVPETKTTGININRDIAKIYIKTVMALNKKHNEDINPVCLASWLCKMFFKAFNVKYMADHYKEKFGQIRKV